MQQQFKVGHLIRSRNTATLYRITRLEPNENRVLIESLHSKAIMNIGRDRLNSNYFELVSRTEESSLASVTDIRTRKALGLCPACGRVGEFINFAMTCSEHGAY